MRFKAVVKDSSGARRIVIRDAASEHEAATALRSEGFVILSLAPDASASGASGDGGGDGKEPPFWHPSWLRPARVFDAEIGLRQLSSMVRSGVSLLAALETTANQALCPRAARIWRSVRDSVASGRTFAEALAAHRRIFDGATVALVRVGEKSGELDVALLHAAGQLESRRAIRSLFANALAYPAFAIAAALGVAAFLVLAVIPKIAEFLASGGAQLPVMTQNLVDLSEWLRAKWIVVIGSIAAVVAAWLAVRAVPAGRLAQDSLALRMPIVGRICRLSGTAVFARAMGMLVGSGVTLLDSLDVTRGLLRNRRLSTNVGIASDAVLHGGALAPPLRAAGGFMPMLAQMVAVGETTGSLSDSFAEVARFHEEMLGVAVKRFGVLVEPAVIVLTGLIVGYVYVSFFLALFSMAGMS